ncbi:hypothetical protein Ga0080559_TMP3513 [Salipiger profundus]|uniref:Uncharacterized protein n=1 Tax=Salipiger profundus TaxID=1229727 RepID=A0A1U7D850_9RHOB|nr:hypothetical protein Ga0080559_TMP3513 [Salipiger profundus]
MEDHGNAHLCGLPGGLGPGHAAAYDMQCLCHAGADRGSEGRC